MLLLHVLQIDKSDKLNMNVVISNFCIHTCYNIFSGCPYGVLYWQNIWDEMKKEALKGKIK